MSRLLDGVSGLLLRAALLVPLVLFLITGILTAVTTSSGTKPGTLQHLAIFKLNVSQLDVASGITPETNNRRNAIGARGLVDDVLGALTGALPSSNGPRPSPTSALGGLLGQNSSLGAIAGAFSGQLIGSVAQEIEAQLGVPDWYSLHPRTFCSGNYNNPNDAKVGIVVRSCTTPGKRVGSLHEALGFDGPLANFPEQFPLPKVLNRSGVLAIDVLSAIITLLSVVFILATVLSFLAMLANAVAIILPHNKIVVITNTVLAGAAGTLVAGGYIGSFIVTIVVSKRLNTIFEDFNVVGSLGSEFLGIGIAATLLSLGAAGIWGIVFIVRFRARLLVLFKVVFSRFRPIADTKVY
ncbi:hypothetical protein G6O67_006631 [Ophiocordyceps sinensis]|uniref:Actin cortical patch SUR7/pH-response regulator PalI n=1 Tax=Ophiocordyceps sinensis TaxID=72228 RepID=A0A8H4PP74_9HYPO|nr:hypothetical protein G6O67_006631 [Ophiocordyceps sinensis]